MITEALYISLVVSDTRYRAAQYALFQSFSTIEYVD